MGTDYRMCRMLYLVNQFAVAPDQPGGTRHFEMAREFVRRQLLTTIVASDLNLSTRCYLRRADVSNRRYLRETVDGVDFAWLPAGNYEANDWRRAFSMAIFSMHVFWFLIRAPMPPGTVVIGSSPHLLAAVAARFAAFVRRVPFVLEVRDLWPESLRVSGARPGPLYPVLRLVADVLYRTSQAIVVLAAGNLDRIAERGADRALIHYVPNGVDPSVFDGAEVAPLPQVPEGRRAFIYAGAHGPANGLDLVLAAAAELQRRGDDRIHVVLVGDGPSKKELVAAARNGAISNVSFLDPVPKSQIPGLMKASVGAIMPLADVELFRYGVSPNKLFDYLCSGLPVITNVPGDVARIVMESKAGIVVAPGDPTGLADAMVRVLEGEVDGNGRDWVLKHHDRGRLAAELAAVVRSVSR